MSALYLTIKLLFFTITVFLIFSKPLIGIAMSALFGSRGLDFCLGRKLVFTFYKNIAQPQ